MQAQGCRHPPVQKCSNTLLSFFFSYFADIGIKGRKQHDHNTACTVSTALLPRQAEHQGRMGGKHEGEKEHGACKAEIKMQKKTIAEEIKNKRGKFGRQALVKLTGEAMRGAHT